MTIKVGIPVSLTGQFSLQGAQTLAGLRVWAADVNRCGGLRAGGRQSPVEIVWRDDGSRRARARAITQRLIDTDGADILIGPYSAVLTNAAAEVAQARGRLLWNQGGASPTVYQRGNPWVVGILTPADEYLAGLLPAVREACPAAATVVIVRATTGVFPRDIAAGVERAAAGLGFRITQSLQFNPQAPVISETLATPEIPVIPAKAGIQKTLDDEFGEIVRAIGESPPDVLVVAGRFQNDLKLAELLAESAPPIGAVAVVAAGVDAFRERLGGLAANFTGPSQWEPDAGYAVNYGPGVAQVLASFDKLSTGGGWAGHPVIDYPAAQAYAVGVVIQRCAEECGSLADAELRQAAASLDFTTFYGRFRIDADTGRPIGKPALLVQWRQGRKAVVWPPQWRRQRLACPWR